MLSNSSDFQSIYEARLALSELKKELAENIRTIIKCCGLTLKEIELETGISISTISRILNNTSDYQLESAFYILYAFEKKHSKMSIFENYALLINIWRNYTYDEQEIILKLFSDIHNKKM